MTHGHGTRGFQWLGSRYSDQTCSKKDVAFVSKAVTWAAKLLTTCSIFVFFASHEATVWENVRTQFSNLDTLCMSSGNFAQIANISLIFSSNRIGTVSCSFEVRKRTVMRIIFEKEAGMGRRNRHTRSITRTCLEKCIHQLSQKGWSKSEVIRASALCKLQKTPSWPVPWDNWLLWSHRKIGFESHGKKETTRKTTLSHSSDHEERPSNCSYEFHVCDVVSINLAGNNREKLATKCYQTQRRSKSDWRWRQQNLSTGHLILAGRTQHGPRAVVSILKMLSVFGLGGDASLWGMNAPSWCFNVRIRHKAEGRSLQSQLHKVNGRSASGDRIIRPLSSMSEVWGVKTVWLSAKLSGTAPPSKKTQKALKRNFEFHEEFNRLPCLTPSRERPKKSISVGTQSSRGDKELRPDAIRFLPWQFTIRHLLSLSKKNFEFCKRIKRITREIVVVVKLLQKKEQRTGHPTGNNVCSGVLDLFEHWALGWWKHLRHLLHGREIYVGQPILSIVVQIVFQSLYLQIDLDWRKMTSVLVQQEGALVAQGIPSSLHQPTKSWHFGSCFKTQAWRRQNFLCNEFWQVRCMWAYWDFPKESLHSIHGAPSLTHFSLSTSTSFFLSFSVYFLHSDLHPEFDNAIAMESLCYSANKESDDAHRRLHLPHKLWAQLHGLQRASTDSSGSFSYIIPVIGPGYG